VIFGNSRGGGPGALGAATLNDNGLIALEGPPMPKGVPLVLQAPFVRATPDFLNEAFGAVSKVPLVNRIKLPALGLPILTTDADAMAKFGNHASAEDVRAQSRSMTAANDDLAAIMALVNEGKGPTGRVYVLHEKDDPLADSNGSVELVRAIGSRARLDLIEGGNHILEEGPNEQAKFLPGIRWATVR
jgi:pimeloyl-ACP methyl ester carboxylesterase